MKKKLLLSLLLSVVAGAQAETYAIRGENITGANTGENNLYLGFYSASELSTKSVLINLGTSVNVGTGFDLDLRGVGALTSNYGINWFNSAQVYWSLIGYDGGYGGYGNFYVGRPSTMPLLQTDISGSTALTEDQYYALSDKVGSLTTAHDALAADRSSVIGSSGNTHSISVVDNSPVAFSGMADANFSSFTTAVYEQITGGLSIQQFTFDGVGSFPTTSGAFSGVTQSNGIISFKPLVTPPSSYTGPWNWSAGTGNWSATTNWTNSQPASEGSVVGITGAGGTITIDTNVSSISSLTFSNGAGTYTLAGTNSSQALGITGGITNNSAAQQTIDLSIAGTGGVTQSGSGTMVLSRSNSYIGGTTLSSGAVEIRDNNALGTGTVTVTGASALIAGAANLSTTNAMAFNASATTIDTGSNRWTNAGTLSGSGSLTKIGTGTLAIAGTGSTFAGNTLITNGALQIASGSSLGSGTVTVASGAKLSGSGTVGGVLVQSNGILNAGVDGGVGKLTVSQDMTLSAGGILNWKLADANGAAGTGFDTFDVRGTLDLTGLTTGSTLQFNILNATGGTVNFLNSQNSQWLVASTGSITGFSADDFTIRTAGFTNALGGGAFGFITNATGLYLKFTALGVDPWTGNLAAGSNVISSQAITSTNNAVIGANSSRNGSVAVTNNGVWNINGSLQVGGSTNGSGTLTIGSGGRLTASSLTISDLRGSKGLVLITNGASQNAISLGSGTVSFGAGNGTLQFAQSNAVTLSNAISGKGTISSTGTGTTTLSGNQAGFTGTNYISSGKVVLGAGVTNGGTLNIAGRGTSVVFAMNTNSVLSSTGTHAVAGLLLDNSARVFTNAIRGQVVLAPTGVLQKTYATNQSVAGFGAGIGAGKSFSILAGTAASNGTNTPTLQAKIVNGQLDFHGTTTNSIVMSMKDPSYSTIRNQIQWFNTNVPVGQKGYWTNTTAGNGMNGTTANVSFGDIENMLVGTNKTRWNETKGGFTGSFNTFLLGVNGSVGFGTIDNLNDPNNLLEDINALSGDMIQSYLNKIMGAFGYDNSTKTSWAVINHNSIFGDGSATFSSSDLLNEPVVADLSVFNPAPVQVQAVPEPGTWALLILGGLVLAFVDARRTRS